MLGYGTSQWLVRVQSKNASVSVFQLQYPDLLYLVSGCLSWPEETVLHDFTYCLKRQAWTTFQRQPIIRHACVHSQFISGRFESRNAVTQRMGDWDKLVLGHQSKHSGTCIIKFSETMFFILACPGTWGLYKFISMRSLWLKWAWVVSVPYNQNYYWKIVGARFLVIIGPFGLSLLGLLIRCVPKRSSPLCPLS